MKTNRFVNIKSALYIAVSVLLSACTIEDANENVAPFSEMLDIAETLQLTATDTEKSFEIKSDAGWDIAIDKGSWSELNASSTSGNGNSTITLRTDANTTRQGREATITVTTKGGVSQQMKVSQSLSDVILDIAGGDNQSLEFEASPEDPKNFSFTCNSIWEITTSDSWIHCNQTEGGQAITTTQNYPISVTVDEIQTDVPREGQVIISAENGAKVSRFTIKQEGKKIELVVSPSNFEVVATGEEKTIQITCNADWKLEYDEGNILCDVTEGTGTQDVKVTCLPNNVNKVRTVTVSVSSGIQDIKTETVTFTQAAATPPVLTAFTLNESSITKNEAEFLLSFETMYPIEDYGIYIWEDGKESSTKQVLQAKNSASGINELKFKATGLKSMTKYHAYGFIKNTVGSSDSQGSNVIIFTTAGVKPDDGDNPVPNLSIRKK